MTIARSAAPDAAGLLDSYRPGTPFFFASPRGTLLTEGTYFEVPRSVRDNGIRDLPDRVAAVLDLARAAGHDDPLVVGAVPFDDAAPARLAVPDRVRRAGPLPAGLTGPPGGRPDGPVRITELPAADEYATAVERAVGRMRAGELDKVVLCRALELTGAAPFDLTALVRRLAANDPRGHTFAVDLGGERTLLGSSPELLVSRSGQRVTANPLAGSLPRSADPVEDQRRASALLASAKDRYEHGVVVEAVAGALAPFCAELTVPTAPVLISTATMWHLSTTVTGWLADPGTSALALACALHPTPAVCGTPVGTARRVIAEYEPFDRGFYTGMVGWGDASGDGEWVVTIRCAVAEESTLRLYAGAGVVADSTPAAELAETSAKFRTLLDGLGL